MTFIINMKYVKGGTVRGLLDAGDGEGWTGKQTEFRVRQLFKPLAFLHDMGISHCDINPLNVFFGNRMVLRLGDFGLAEAWLHLSGVHADVLKPAFEPRGLGAWWRPAVGGYQVGLLMTSLLAGDEGRGGICKPQVNNLTERRPLRDAIKAAIGIKSQRPCTAAELAGLLDAARNKKSKRTAEESTDGSSRP